MKRDEISAGHRTRQAYLYIRQSSLHQVEHNQESQRRQRSLIDRALELGWSRELIVEIDEDLGRSASRSGSRSGFETMVSEAAVGKVGLILALEVSRVSRGNRVPGIRVVPWVTGKAKRWKRWKSTCTFMA
jgi:DNA invertase Pin-like site-specific DNA recombinase